MSVIQIGDEVVLTSRDVTMSDVGFFPATYLDY